LEVLNSFKWFRAGKILELLLGDVPAFDGTGGKSTRLQTDQGWSDQNGMVIQHITIGQCSIPEVSSLIALLILIG